MPPLTQLLDVQELDLAGDKLSLRRLTLPEREELKRSSDQAAVSDEEHATTLERREALSQSERKLSGEVAAFAAKAKEVEDTLYSGRVKMPKELEALQEEIRLVRERQSGVEEQQMQLLEEIDQAETEMAENRAARMRADTAAKELEAAILKAEAEIDSELERLAGQRNARSDGLPAAIVTEYDRLRTKERLKGRAAARLEEGRCGGCRVGLPVHEYSRMKAKPADALLCCVHCGRVLVR